MEVSMHKMNVKQIVFHGKDGKIAIKQILNAEPIKNKFTTTVYERSASAVLKYKPLKAFAK